MNEYDSLLGQDDDEQANEYDDLLKQEQNRQAQARRATMLRATSTDPDQYAQARETGKRLSLPPDVVERNKEEAERQVKLNEYDARLKANPKLAEAMQDEDTARMAYDELSTLEKIQRGVTDVFEATDVGLEQGTSQIELARIRSRELFGSELGEAERRRIAELHETIKKDYPFSGAADYFYEAFKVAPQFWESIKAGGEYGAQGAVGGATAALIAGQFGPQVATPEEIATVPGAAAAGFGLGFRTGAAENAFILEAGLAYDEFLEFEDENGKPLDPQVARVAALAVGGVNASLEFVGFKTVLKTIPGGEKLLGRFTTQGVKQALRNPNIRQAFTKFAKNYSKAITAETATEIAQESVNMLAGEIAKASSEGSFEGIEAKEVGERLVGVAQKTAKAMAVLGAPGPGASFAVDTHRARNAKERPPGERLNDAVDAVRESKLRERDPEKFRSAVDTLTKGEELYISADDAAELFQSQPELRSQLSERIPELEQQIAEALATGTDIKLSTADYLTHIAPDFHEATSPYIRVSPEQMSAAEARRFEESETLEQEFDAEVDAQTTEQQGRRQQSDALERVENDITMQLVNTGKYDFSEAQANAQQMAAVFGNLSTRYGAGDPEALYRQYGPQILAQHSLLRESAGDELNVVIGNLRAIAEGREVAPEGSDRAEALATISEELTNEGLDLAEATDAEIRTALENIRSREPQRSESMRTLFSPERQAVEQQRARDQAFERWFEGSKIVDANGDPLTVYHGTSADITEFDTSGMGAHFGTQEQSNDRLSAVASNRPERLVSARGRKQVEGANALPAYLNIQNPLRTKDAGRWHNSVDVARVLLESDLAKHRRGDVRQELEEIHAEASELQEQYREQEEQLSEEEVDFEKSLWTKSEENQRLLEELKSVLDFNGYDGIIYRNEVEGVHAGLTPQPENNDSYIVFDPRQIKSAVGNRGTFDPTSGNILEQAGSLEQLRDYWNGQGVELAVSEHSGNGVIVLRKLVVPKEQRGQDLGSQVMRDLTDYADARGQVIATTPSKDFGGSSVSRLKRFYKRHGFVENRGRNKDYSISESMLRPPKVSKTLFQEQSELPGIDPAPSPDGPIFYSALERTIEDKLPGSGAPKQLAQTLESWAQKGQIKQEELDWSGLVGWLREQSGKVTKDQVLEFLRANQIQVDEVVLGEDGNLRINPDDYSVDTQHIDNEPLEDFQAEEIARRTWQNYIDEVENDLYERELEDLRDEEYDSVRADLIDDHTIEEDDGTVEIDEDGLEDAIENRLREMASSRVGDLSRTGDVRDLATEAAERAAHEEYSQELWGDSVELPNGDVVEFSVTGNDELGYEVGAIVNGDFETIEDLADSVASADALATDWLRSYLENEEVSGDGTQYGEYTLEGGEDYKELLLTLERLGEESFRSSHFDEPDILAHVRFKTRTDEDGKRVLFIEEIQSDWHQAGRKKGYKGQHSGITFEVMSWAETLDKAVRKGEMSSQQAVEQINTLLDGGVAVRDNTHLSGEFQVVDRDGNLIESSVYMLTALSQANEKLARSGAVPDAPFKTTWPMLAFKRVIRWATDNGFDRIAWTTGKQQADRYNLRNHVDAIEYRRLEDGTFNVLFRRGGVNLDRLARRGIGFDDLADLVGMELAKKIANGEGVQNENFAEPGWMTLADQDLEVGGEGMLKFYDKILPNEVKKYTKKWGAKPGKTKISTGKEQVIGYRLVNSRNQRLSDELFGSADEAYSWLSSQYAEDPEQRPLATTVAVRDEVPETVHALDVTDEMRLAAKQGQTLFQRPGSGRRGAITFPSSGLGSTQPLITLFERADLSTFLHESGHLYLELMRSLAQQPDAPAGLQQDLEAVRAWWLRNTEEIDGLVRGRLTEEQKAELDTRGGADYVRRVIEGTDESADAIDQAIAVELHEYFARGYEAYLAEGKAPSNALRAAFQRFAAWLKAAYRNLASLNVQLDDEIRDFFDRLLAADEEIQAAREANHTKPVFTNPEQAGMTDAEWQAYTQAAERARHEAEAELERRTVAYVYRQRKQEYQEKRKQVRAEVEAEVNQRREYRALHFLMHGKALDGELPEGVEPVKLDRGALEAEYGPGVLTALPGGGPTALYRKEGGVHPDVVAELFGYSSGDEMIQDFLRVPKRQAAIEVETDQRMRQVERDPMLDGNLAEEAIEALHNDEQGRFLEGELRALARRAGQEGTPANVARELARERVSRTRVIDANKVAHYRAAELRAAKAAERAILQEDFAEAARQKRIQLFNHYMYQETRRAAEDVDKAVRYLKKFASPGTRKNLDVSYLDQIDALLARFDLRKGVSRKAIERRNALAAWVEERRNEGLEVVIPDRLLNEAFRQSYKELTVAELRELRDSVKNIEHIARLKKKLLTLQEKRNFDETVDSLVHAARENNTWREDPPDFVGGKFERFKDWGELFLAEHVKMEFLFQQLDGNKHGGPWWSALFKPLADAETAEQEMMEQATQRMNELTRNLDRRGFHRKVYIEQLGASFTKDSLLSIALNWGNDGNRQALVEGYGWTLQAVQSALDEHLTAQDWEFVQGMWDLINSYWPQIAELQRELSGVTPEKVPPTPVHTKHGTFRGGYYPLKYDTKLNFIAFKRDEQQQTQELFGSNWLRPSTRQGHTKERVGSGGQKVKLDLSVATEHINNVIHDLTHRKALMDVDRLTQDSRVREAVEATAGRQVYRMIRPWLSNIAGDRRELGSAVEHVLHHLRVGGTIVNMGWKLTTAIVQPLGYLQSVELLGEKWSWVGLQRVLNPAEMKKTVEFVRENSTMMRNRQKTFDRDVRDSVKRLTGPMWKQKVEASFFSHIGLFDMMVSVPTWVGAYEKSMAEQGDHDAAVAYADSIVRMSQSSGGAKDLAAIQQGRSAKRIFTMFYSYFSVLYNLLRRRGKITAQGQEGVHRLATSFMYLVVLPSVLSELIVGRGPDDDEDPAAWTFKTIAGYPFQSIVGVRDIASGIISDYGYEFSPVAGALETTVRAADSVGDIAQGEADENDIKNILMTGGYLFHLPMRQLWHTSEALYDLSQGEDVNPWEVLVYRKPD